MQSHADAKSLELETLVIKNIVVQQAPVCSLSFTPALNLICHVDIILAACEEEVERSRDKEVATSSLTGLNRREVARRRIEAGRA
jgi:large subunit ribosomal protein L17e